MNPTRDSLFLVHPLGINAAADKINFYPYLVYKDRVGLLIYLIIFSALVWFAPNILAHPDNNIPANSLVTPLSIVPEWYFCAPMRCIDRSLTPDQFRCRPHPRNCKAWVPVGAGNRLDRSGTKSGVRGVGRPKKRPRAKLSTVKIMNLNYVPSVLPYTHATHLLTRAVSHSELPGSKAHFSTTGSRNAKQAPRAQGPKLRSDDQYGTSGLPTTRKGYGNGSAVVAGTSNSSGQGQKDESLNSARHINCWLISHQGVALAELYKINVSCKDYVNKNLIHLIGDLKTLQLSYELIKSKPGNMTPAHDKQETLDGASLKLLSNLSKKLAAGKYKFSRARRIYIPKPGKSELRPLTIPSPREKIVQKALQLVLEGIYEPSFLPCSHGFRPGRGTHTALKMIDQKCKNANWFIEADISKCFDSIDHTKLLTLLKRRIECDKTVALLKSALKAGHASPGVPLAKAGDTGTPQGSVLSPILCNIYMHQLDTYMLELQRKYNRGVRRRQNPEYTKLNNLLSREKDPARRAAYRSQMKQGPSGDPMDPNMIRTVYVRYADDFIISVLGPYSLAKTLKTDVEEYLDRELELKVNLSKSVITDVKAKAAMFLGTAIRTGKRVDKPQGVNRDGKKVRLTPRPSLHAPLEKIFAKLKIQGFIKYGSQSNVAIPTALRRMINMDHADILRYYNNVNRGILNYYSFASNRKSLGSVVRTLQMSCARTLALKCKLRFASKAFKKFGSKLVDPQTEAAFYIPADLKRTRIFKTKAASPLAALEKSWANKLTRSNLNKCCAVCGCIPVEMHHVKSIKELKSRKHLDWFTMQMAAINRKQVPLCKEHHKKLHGGKLSPAERDAFREELRSVS
jgi:group II intron reverse transcriptase/maturase